MRCAAERTGTALWTCAAPIRSTMSYVTELGEPGFVSLAFDVESEEDLDKAARIDGASPVEEMDEPGGGKRVRLTELQRLHASRSSTASSASRRSRSRDSRSDTGPEGLARSLDELTFRIDRGPYAREAHRPRRPDDPRPREFRRLGARDARLGLLGRRLCGRRRWTTSSSPSTGSIAERNRFDHHVFLYVQRLREPG